jgi:hypothetical protein
MYFNTIYVYIIHSPGNVIKCPKNQLTLKYASGLETHEVKKPSLRGKAYESLHK